MTHSSSNLATPPRAFAFSAKLFEFNLVNAHTFFEEKYLDPQIDDKMKTGFTKFLDSLNLYLDQLPDLTSADESKVNIYGSVTLENGAIMRANNKYYGEAWFSDVSVRMHSDESVDYISDQGICYGQVIINYLFVFFTKFDNNYSLNFVKILLIVRINVKGLNKLLNLALIQ